MENKIYLTAVLLTATILFNGCSKKDDDNNNPTPTPVPVASFTYSGAGVQAPATVTFTNSSTNATSYSWDFGDNGTSTDKDPQHTYTSGGVYTVQLTVTGAGGTNSISKTVNIQNTPTTCKITSVKL
ncbi:MAG TPA: PKD domain-containing protein, partial [Bacteroidia bacterium]|nr:PKD domain-containing protein [Bacteroidia bacterium]